MEEIREFLGRLERAKLQLRSLQRTARTTLQVTTDLIEEAERLEEILNARSEEDAAYEHHSRTSANHEGSREGSGHTFILGRTG